MSNAITVIVLLFGVPMLLVAGGLWRWWQNKPISGLILILIGSVWAWAGYQLLFMGRA